jgi:predicted DCC family thiol-disulfide oxidoreductase YuxK
MREVNMLKRRDAGKGKIAFVDIADPTYTPEANGDISFEQAMGTIHGILPDGKVITNVDVFRRLYGVVGLGWVYAFTRYEPLNRLANAVYGVWAKYRLPITGRPDLETVLRDRSQKTCR